MITIINVLPNFPDVQFEFFAYLMKISNHLDLQLTKNDLEEN